VFGKGFSVNKEYRCVFGNIAVPARAQSATVIQCGDTPPREVGLVQFFLEIVDSGDLVGEELSFYYYGKTIEQILYCSSFLALFIFFVSKINTRSFLKDVISSKLSSIDN
jgi:hypothetical protein